MRKIAFLVCLAGLFMLEAAAARGGGRRGGRGRAGVPGQGLEQPTMRWLPTREAALAAAAKHDPALPVLCYLVRAAGPVDKRDSRGVFGDWDVARRSRVDFAAFRVDVDTDEGRGMVARYGVKRDGTILWFDGHGNCVGMKGGNLRTADVTNTILKWRASVEAFEKKVEKRIREAKEQFRRERHGKALEQIGPLADVGGPLGERIQKILEAVEARGTQLLEMVEQSGCSGRGRKNLLEAVAREFRGSRVEERAKEILAQGRAAPSEPPDPPSNARGRVRREPAKPANGRKRPPGGDAESAKEGSSVPAGKPSIEAMMAKTRVDEGAAGSDDAKAGASPPPPDGRSATELLAAAGNSYKEGLKAYQRAAEGKADSRQLYAEGFRVLTEALELAEHALGLRGTRNVVVARKLVQDISALRYACFKCQPL